jgi:hypothetical protein
MTVYLNELRQMLAEVAECLERGHRRQAALKLRRIAAVAVTAALTLEVGGR